MSGTSTASTPLFKTPGPSASFLLSPAAEA
ncbi:MAG: hypothetical protein ACI9CV_001290 [Ilumatobacter sp.]|jgi:hypothetical protein